MLEFPLDGKLLDVSGWELRKALQLFLDSNPALYEWLVSPTVYLEHGELACRLRILVQRYYSRKKLAWHYLRMAEKNFDRHIEGKVPIRFKKYLYVIRPLLMLQWMEQKQALPPIGIHDVIGDLRVPVRFTVALRQLLLIKSGAPETAEGKPIPAIDDWIQSSLISARAICDKAEPRHCPAEELDRLFRELVTTQAR